MNVLKIGYFADGIWAHNSFELLIKDETIDIKFICVRYDSTDEVLVSYGKKYNIPVLKHKRINDKEFLDLIAEFNCDLFVSMSFNQIFRNEIINLPKLNIINCHAGKLPFYRGRNILNWVLINDEKEFGITVHFVDNGIDTGDIILQKSYNITDEDDYNSLLTKAHTECANLLYEAIKQIQNNTYKRIPQASIHPVGMYCGIRKFGDEIINWNKTSREIFNFVRALAKPGPQATSYLEGKEFKINKVSIVKDAPNYIGIAGQIIGRNDEKIIVKTKDSFIEIIDFLYEGRIRVGGRFNE